MLGAAFGLVAVAAVGPLGRRPIARPPAPGCPSASGANLEVRSIAHRQRSRTLHRLDFPSQLSTQFLRDWLKLGTWLEIESKHQMSKCISRLARQGSCSVVEEGSWQADADHGGLQSLEGPERPHHSDVRHPEPIPLFRGNPEQGQLNRYSTSNGIVPICSLSSSSATNSHLLETDHPCCGSISIPIWPASVLLLAGCSPRLDRSLSALCRR